MLTLPSSTMMGTLRRPPECLSISGMRLASRATLTYSNWIPLAVNASRAAEVYGQLSLP
jgi:hypothetical protein